MLRCYLHLRWHYFHLRHCYVIHYCHISWEDFRKVFETFPTFLNARSRLKCLRLVFISIFGWCLGEAWWLNIFVRLLKKLLIRSYCGRVPQPCEARALLRAREQSQSPGGSQTDGISDKAGGGNCEMAHFKGQCLNNLWFQSCSLFFSHLKKTITIQPLSY